MRDGIVPCVLPPSGGLFRPRARRSQWRKQSNKHTRKTKKRGYVCEMTSREINEQSQGRLIDLI